MCIRDRRYTGVLIQGKTTTPNHKVKVVIHKEEAEWIRYENALSRLSTDINMKW